MECIAVLTTTASVEEARKIAQELVNRGFAACVQISKIESFYVWDDAVQNEPEYRLVIKTTADRYAEGEQFVPCTRMNCQPSMRCCGECIGPYAEWVHNTVRREHDRNKPDQASGVVGHQGQSGGSPVRLGLEPHTQCFPLLLPL